MYEARKICIQGFETPYLSVHCSDEWAGSPCWVGSLLNQKRLKGLFVSFKMDLLLAIAAAYVS